MFTWSPGMTLEYLEKTTILQALKFYEGNKTTTARALGCAVNTLNSKLERYAMEEKDAQRRAADEERKRFDFERRQRGFIQPPGTGFARDPGVTAAAFQNEIKGSPDSVAPIAGLRVEPASTVEAKPTMPMSERKEVQSVLPKHAPPGSKKGRG